MGKAPSLAALFACFVSGCLVGQFEAYEACRTLRSIRVHPIVDDFVGQEGAGEVAYVLVDETPTSSTAVPVVSLEETVTHDGWSKVLKAAARHNVQNPYVRLRSAELRAREGIESIGLVKEVAFFWAPNGASELPSMLLGHCGDVQVCRTSVETIRFAGNQTPNLSPYIQQDRLETTISLVATPPVRTWVFDVEVCVEVEGTFQMGL